MFDFQDSRVNEKKRKDCTVFDPILFSSNSEICDIYFLLDNIIPNKVLNDLKNFMKSSFPYINYKVLTCFPFKLSEKDFKKNIIDLYLYEKIDLHSYIPDWSKVITVGRAIHSISGSDLNIEGFYDTILWKTSFFAPEIKSQIFPIPHIYSWLGKDTFENFFTLKQIKIASEYKLQKIRLPQPKLILVENPNEHLEQWKSYNGVTAWDLETKTLDPWDPEGKVICLTCAYESELKEYKAYYLPFDKIDTNLLAEWFKTKKLVGNNLKYDVKWQRVKHNIPRECVQIFWDNMKGSHAINEMQYNSLKSDAWLYSFFGGYDLELELYKIKYPKCKNDYSKIPQSIMFPYATMDALVSLICYKRQQLEIDELDKKCPTTTGWSIRRVLEEVSFPAINMFADIEINGMCYDWDKLDIISKDFHDKIEEKKKEVYRVLGMPEDMNIDSGDQLGKFLEEKGWENPGRSQKGFYLTGEDSMLYWKKKGHKEVDLINEYTSLKTVYKTYLGNKEENTGYYQYRKSDNKLHGNFSVSMADSWRGKGYDPNLQNIPSHGELAKIIRSLFSAPSEDYLISENDASGLQLRIGAVMSNDQQMRDIFTKYGGDMHSITARNLFRPDMTLEEFMSRKKEEAIAETRYSAKAVNFGFEFGQVAYSFSSTLKKTWSFETAKKYVQENKLIARQRRIYANEVEKIDSNKEIFDREVAIDDALEFSYYLTASESIRKKFFETYPGLQQWIKDSIDFGVKNGYSPSMWGPIRRTPYLVYQGKNDDKARIKNYENITANSPVQNWENLYMMYNMVRVHKDIINYNLKSYLIGNVHDSAISYIHKTELDIMKDIFVKYFHEEIPELMKGIPFILEGGYSDYYKDEYWHVTENKWF